LCHHLIDEVLSKMKDPDAQVVNLLHWQSHWPELTLSVFLLMYAVWDNSTSNQGVWQGSRPCPAGKLFVTYCLAVTYTLRVLQVSYTTMQFVGLMSSQ
jgi:hypothetical protein